MNTTLKFEPVKSASRTTYYVHRDDKVIGYYYKTTDGQVVLRDHTGTFGTVSTYRQAKAAYKSRVLQAVAFLNGGFGA